jgi:hypothetical protein
MRCLLCTTTDPATTIPSLEEMCLICRSELDVICDELRAATIEHMEANDSLPWELGYEPDLSEDRALPHRQAVA